MANTSTKLVRFAALALFWLLHGSAAHAQGDLVKKRLTLRVGDQTSISARDVLKYSEATKGIVDVRLPDEADDSAPLEFVIVALKPGTTTLLLFMRGGGKVQYEITVSGTTTSGAVKEIENIRLDFYFVEVSNNYTRQLGLGFPSAIGGGEIFRIQGTYDLIGGDFINATAVVANQPLPRLDILHSTGWAKIARQAAVITANGNEANFSSGGEVNITVQGALTAEIRQIEFGSNIKVLPRYDASSGRVELRIASEVSELTSDRGSGVPGRTIAKIDTIVNVELGQGVMLAGLNSQSERHSKSGLPFLSQIPVLGMLFGSHGTQSEQINNVVFIVPTVVNFVSKDSRERITDALKVYRKYSGDSDVDLIGQPAPKK